MRISQLLLVLLFFTVTSGAAESYSCRDSHGRLHLADSPGNLPEECLGQEQKHQSGAVDNLNYVPMPVEPAANSGSFERSVRAADRELLQQRQAAEQLQQRAEQLASSYETAVSDKRQAKRRWSYGSRETILGADRRIEQARDGKRKLLQELSGSRLSDREEVQVRALLERVAE